MASVYVNNIVINTGSNFIQSFDLESADTNSALNLTGYTASSQMRKYSGSSNAINFNVSISSPETLGRIIISLGSTETASLKPGRYVYDILITETATSKKIIVVEGMALVREGVTR